MTTKRDGDTSRTVPVDLFMSSDGKREWSVATMLCEKQIAIRSIVVEEPTSIDTSSVNVRFDKEKLRLDVVAAQSVPPIPVRETAEIEGLLLELELFSPQNVTVTPSRDETVSDEPSEVDMNTMLILL
jgi:hypothetical protein